MSKKKNYSKALGYSLPQLTQQIITMSAATYMLYFYQDLVGLAGGAVSLMLLLTKMWDSFNDPVIGWFVDEKVKYGKRGKFKPLFKWGTIISLITLGLQFTVVSESHRVSLIYFYIVMMVGSIFATVSGIAFPTLAGSMTPDKNQRTLFTVFRSVAGMIGGILATIVVMPMVKYFGQGNDMKGFTYVIWFLMGICIIITIIANKLIVEVKIEKINEKKNESPFKHMAIVFKNKAVVATFLMSIFIMFALNVRQSLQIYYLKFILGNEMLLGAIAGASMTVMAISLFFVPKLTRKIGKLKAIALGIGIHILTSVIMLCFQTDILIIIVASAISGLGVALVNITSFTLQLDSIEYQEWLFGNRQEGAVYSIYGLVIKFGGALAPAFGGIILTLFNYSPEEITKEGIRAIQTGYFYVPIAFFVIALIMVLINPMKEKKMDQVRADLLERRGEGVEL